MRLTKYEHLTPIVAPDAAPLNDFSAPPPGRASTARRAASYPAARNAGRGRFMVEFMGRPDGAKHRII